MVQRMTTAEREAAEYQRRGSVPKPSTPPAAAVSIDYLKLFAAVFFAILLASMILWGIAEWRAGVMAQHWVDEAVPAFDALDAGAGSRMEP